MQEKHWCIREWWGTRINPFIVPTPRVYCPSTDDAESIA